MSAKKNKKVKRKFRIFIVILVFLLIISFAGLMIGAYVLQVDTKAIIVHNNRAVTDDEIMELAGVEEYPNFFLTSSKDIETKLKKNAFIRDVDVKKTIHFQIHIYVDEYKPLFIREDTNMIVFAENKEVINDESFSVNVPFLVNYVPDTKYKELIEKMGVIDDYLIQKISQIVYSPTKYDEDRFIFYMNDSNKVYINLPKFKSFNKYDEMVTKLEGKTGKLYLDSGNYFEIDK